MSDSGIWKRGFKPCKEEELPDGFPVLNALAKEVGVGGTLVIYFGILSALVVAFVILFLL